MNVKKTVLSVILGVAAVSLATAVIVVLIDGFTMLVDYKGLSPSKDYAYNYVIGALEIVFAFMALIFAVVIPVLRRRGFVPAIVFAGVSALYFMVTVIILRTNVDSSPYSLGDYIYIDRLDTQDYTLFTSYMTNTLTITISAIISSVAYALLCRDKSSQAQAPITTVSAPTAHGTPAAPAQTVAHVAPASTVAPAAPVQSAAPQKEFCPQCGKEHSVGAKFCSKCGYKLD